MFTAPSASTIPVVAAAANAPPGIGSGTPAPPVEFDSGIPVPVAAPAPKQRAYRLRRAPLETPVQLQNAVPPASERFGSRRGPGAADGCRAKLIVQAQGYFEEHPVRATLELQRTDLRVTGVPFESGARFSYQGKLDGSLCDHPDEGDVLAFNGSIETKQGKPPRFSVSLRRNSYFDVDRGRLRLEAFEEGSSEATLRLWDTPLERLELRNSYQKALGQPDDVEVVLNGPDDTLLVASLGLEDRSLTLTQLARSPLRVKQRVETSLACGYHECHASLVAFEISAQLTALVAGVSGQNCGAKCVELAEGQLWTLSSEGFHFGQNLASTEEMPGGLTYSGHSSHTALSWV
ncbi:MAG: hypothetical protein ABW061_14750, partial [Polyangiaceae bacterium]